MIDLTKMTKLELIDFKKTMEKEMISKALLLDLEKQVLFAQVIDLIEKAE